ncbi:MAG: hypothetical protein DHS80DRAFT_25266 [Piptocephalis tieghemiana]|nr:MAG: hypothetical protein DHS80DRAFT_25266 [Piptocephalis tieghemiana]
MLRVKGLFNVLPGKTVRVFTTTRSSAKQQFILIARDYKDPEVMDRRLSVRADHLARAQELKKTGQILMGGAILSPSSGLESSSTPGKMIGSIMIMEAKDEAEVRRLLRDDPYVTGKVWETMEILPFKVALKE